MSTATDGRRGGRRGAPTPHPGRPRICQRSVMDAVLRFPVEIRSGPTRATRRGSRPRPARRRKTRAKPAMGPGAARRPAPPSTARRTQKKARKRALSHRPLRLFEPAPHLLPMEPVDLVRDGPVALPGPALVDEPVDVILPAVPAMLGPACCHGKRCWTRERPLVTNAGRGSGASR